MHPLHNLTKKDTPFTWAEPQQTAFDALKQAFTSEPILAVFDPSRPTHLEVDASGYATGGVLSQKCDDELWHPIAYRPQSMTEAEHNYEIYDREMCYGFAIGSYIFPRFFRIFPHFLHRHSSNPGQAPAHVRHTWHPCGSSHATLPDPAITHVADAPSARPHHMPTF